MAVPSCEKIIRCVICLEAGKLFEGVVFEGVGHKGGPNRVLVSDINLFDELRNCFQSSAQLVVCGLQQAVRLWAPSTRMNLMNKGYFIDFQC